MNHIGFGLVLDVADPDAVAPFWAAALSYTVVGGVGNYVMLLPEGRSGPKLLLQRVPEGKTGKNRMHLDIDAPDIEAEAERLQALGARRLEPGQVQEHGHRWIRMADPEGNEFCLSEAAAA
ncbi:VOC family protein [Nonomuraea africana]|uniref:Enzyme related to lactoylglutathione lyase n=1 Tax=Nonomuraea africana TaxID=46171 RepID=A0ABR9KED0_9ACTN|nr:VOC family protein [Nonomuraea africana]MBE1560359.1 putative enzyme related to lactoylglutathione lyase [Nonomuraea africana]